MASPDDEDLPEDHGVVFLEEFDEGGEGGGELLGAEVRRADVVEVEDEHHLLEGPTGSPGPSLAQLEALLDGGQGELDVVEGGHGLEEAVDVGVPQEGHQDRAAVLVREDAIATVLLETLKESLFPYFHWSSPRRNRVPIQEKKVLYSAPRCDKHGPRVMTPYI